MRLPETRGVGLGAFRDPFPFNLLSAVTMKSRSFAGLFRLPSFADSDSPAGPNLTVDRTGTAHADATYLFSGRRLTCFLNAYRRACPESHPDRVTLAFWQPVRFRFAGLTYVVRLAKHDRHLPGLNIAMETSHLVTVPDFAAFRRAFRPRLMRASARRTVSC